jgi:hypothetical protein
MGVALCPPGGAAGVGPTLPATRTDKPLTQNDTDDNGNQRKPAEEVETHRLTVPGMHAAACSQNCV